MPLRRSVVSEFLAWYLLETHSAPQNKASSPANREIMFSAHPSSTVNCIECRTSLLDRLRPFFKGIQVAFRARTFAVVLCGGAASMEYNSAILQYRRMLRYRLAEYENDLLTGYRLAREIADCGLVQAGVRLESAVAHLQREIAQARSQMLVLENIAEKPAKPAEEPNR